VYIHTERTPHKFVTLSYIRLMDVHPGRCIQKKYNLVSLSIRYFFW
jgi:hypothetical protein